MKILTEYRIADCQSPLWQERTDNIFDQSSRLRKLSNLPGLPLRVEKFLIELDNHPWLSAWRLLKKRRAYDLVITGDFRVSRVFALLQSLFPIGRKPQLMIDFMLDDEQPGRLWKIKRSVQRRIFESIDRIILFSENERKVYAQALRIGIERFTALPYHTNVVSVRYLGKHEDYIVSAGNSGRDYATLIKAVKGTGLKLKIITSPACLNGIEIPPDVELYYNIDYMRYLDLLAGAKLVVVPLHNLIRSVGMVVMLEGMSLGKTVIVTRAISVIEYIEQGKNGFLVDPYDEKGLRELLLKLDDKTREKVGKQAVEDVKSRWTFDIFVKALLEVAAGMKRK
ncbi:MAG: glycosyltransferase family 4 protein [bacterium]